MKREMMRKAVRSLAAVGVFLVSVPAMASELSGGVSGGGMMAGSKQSFAVSPHAAIAWRTESGFVFAIRDMLSILVATDKNGAGVHNRTSVMLGYATETASLSVGPSISFYSMPACNAASLCSRVAGVSPGGYAHASFYFAGPLGASVSASIDWVGGSSSVLPGGVAAMIVAGPVLRLTTR
jgi:hypothetical protein